MAKPKKCRYGRDMRFKHRVKCRKAPARGSHSRRSGWRGASPAAAMALEGWFGRRGRRRRRR